MKIFIPHAYLRLIFLEILFKWYLVIFPKIPLLSPQSAYRCHHFTETTILKAYLDISKTTDSDEASFGFIASFSVFALVNHENCFKT